MKLLTHTYHARIQPTNWVLIILLLACTLFFMWQGSGVLCLLPLVMLLLVIERTIHTEYQLNNEWLTIHRGRLSRDTIIAVEDICRVERIRRIRIGKKALVTYLVVVYKGEQTVAVIPQNEDEFVSQLMKIKNRHES